MKKILFVFCALFLFEFSFSQELIYKQKYPFNNVKNFYVSQNNKKQTLLHSYNYSKVKVEIVDSSYKSIYSTTEPFEFVNYEFLSTFYNQDNFYNLYINGKELAMAIISPKGKIPFRFIKIGSITKDNSEEFFCYNELTNKAQFVTINRKESKINLITVTSKGISERNVYDSPVKLSKDFDNSKFGTSINFEKPSFFTIEDEKPQEISTVNNTSKTYSYGSKQLFAFRGKTVSGDFYCTKFLIFDSAQKSFMYKEILDTIISGGFYSVYDNTNFTFYNGNIYFIHLNESGYTIAQFNLSFDEIKRYNYSFSTDMKNINTLYYDGDNNATGNDIILVDSLSTSKQEYISDLFNKKRKSVNLDFKSTIAVNKYKDDISFTIGIARKMYFQVNVGGTGFMGSMFTSDMGNVPMGSAFPPTNLNYKQLFMPYTVVSNCLNYQFRYFITSADENNKFSDIKMKDYPNNLFRESFKNILSKNIKIKELMLNDFSGNYYFSFINKSDNTLELHLLKK